MYKNHPNFVEKIKEVPEFYMYVCNICKRKIKFLIGKCLGGGEACGNVGKATF